MNIAFVTTQSPLQSTLIGRVSPLAKEFQKMGHGVTILGHSEDGSPTEPGMTFIVTGANPFSRTNTGKSRKRGIALIFAMKINALRAAWRLLILRPDVIIIVKPLPENTLAVFLAKLFLWKTKIVLDTDDFELLANKLSSLTERAAIHGSERVAAKLASHVIVATPFLLDHMKQLTGGHKEVTLIPTGLNPPASGENSPSSLSILYIGSISASSGHRVDLLPEILLLVRKEIPTASMNIAGSGDDEHLLQVAFRAKGLSEYVHWLGRFDASNAAEIAYNSSVLVDPIDSSIENRAKSSFRAALALACGVPIVSSNIGIRTMLIPDAFHDRFFAKPQDAASYAKHIITILKNPLSETERSALLSRSREYTWQNLAKQYEESII